MTMDPGLESDFEEDIMSEYLILNWRDQTMERCKPRGKRNSAVILFEPLVEAEPEPEAVDADAAALAGAAEGKPVKVLPLSLKLVELEQQQRDLEIMTGKANFYSISITHLVIVSNVMYYACSVDFNTYFGGLKSCFEKRTKIRTSNDMFRLLNILFLLS